MTSGIRYASFLVFAAVATLTVAASGGAPPPPPPTSPPLSQFVVDHLAGAAVLLHGSGAATTYKVVLLGDGFTADPASIGAYRRAADEVTAGLLAAEPFQALAGALSIYRVDVVSDEAGIDVPIDCGGIPFDPPPSFAGARSPRSVANALDTHWCAQGEDGGFLKRFLTSDTARVSEFALASGVVPDATIVLVNDWMFGAVAWPGPSAGVVYASVQENLIGDVHPDCHTSGQPLPVFCQSSGQPQPVFPTPTTFPGVVVHELGHLAPFDLLDEYGGSPPASSVTALPASLKDDVDASPNLTSELPPNPVPLKWESLLAPGTSIPHDCTSASPPDVGAVPGGEDAHTGVYHSACNCRMRALEHPTFCLVCRRRIFTELAEHWFRAPPWTPRARPRPIWVILDSAHVTSGGPGRYWIQCTVTLGNQRVDGRWPSAGGIRLDAGAATVAGEVLAVLRTPEQLGLFELPAQPPRADVETVRVDYEVRVRLGVNGTGAERSVARETAAIPARELRTDLLAVNHRTHRLTLGVVELK